MTSSTTNVDENNEKTSMTALVFLGRSATRDPIPLVDGLRAAFGDTAHDFIHQPGPSFIFRCGDMIIIVGEIAHQAPVSGTDSLFINALLWTSAWADVGKHQSHLLVSVVGGESGRHRALTLQRALAVIFSVEPSAIGVVDMFSGALLPAVAFTTAGSTSEQTQVLLIAFISCVFARETEQENSGVFCSTKGMASFGAKEVEVHGFHGDPLELYYYVMSLCAYILENSEAIKDGDTVAYQEAERIVVKIEVSAIHSQAVYSLQFR